MLRSTLPLASRAHSWQVLRMAPGSSREEQKEDCLPRYSCHVLRIRGKDRPPCTWRAEEEEKGRTCKEQDRAESKNTLYTLTDATKHSPTIPIGVQFLSYPSSATGSQTRWKCPGACRCTLSADGRKLCYTAEESYLARDLPKGNWFDSMGWGSVPHFWCIFKFPTLQQSYFKIRKLRKKSFSMFEMKDGNNM